MGPIAVRAVLTAILGLPEEAMMVEWAALVAALGRAPGLEAPAPRVRTGAKVRSEAYLERHAERERVRRAHARGAHAGAHAEGLTGLTAGAHEGLTFAPQAASTRASDCSASADPEQIGTQQQTPQQLPSVAGPPPMAGAHAGAHAHGAHAADSRPPEGTPPTRSESVTMRASGDARSPAASEGAPAPHHRPLTGLASTGRPDAPEASAEPATAVLSALAPDPLPAPTAPVEAPSGPAPARVPARPRKRATPALRLVPSGPAPGPAKRASPRTRCPTSDDPNAPAWLAAHGLPALDDPEHGAEITACLDHHGARANTMADWRAAWRTWQRNAVAFAARRAGPGMIGANGLPMSPTNRIDRWGKVRQIEPLLPRDENGVRLLPNGKPEQRLEALPPHLCVGVNENRLAL